MRRLRPTSIRVPASASLAMAALLGLASTTFPAVPAAAVPPYTVEERAAAIASPALIFIDAGLEGYLRVRATGEVVYNQPLAVHSRCGGIVVKSDGHVITPTHCVSMRTDILRSAAASIVANEMIRVGRLAADQKQAFIDNVEKTADFTATTTSSDPPVPKILAEPFVGTTASTIPGRIVTAQPVDEGDVMLIKLDSKGALPVAKLAPASFATGTSVVLAGYVDTDPNDPAPRYTVQWKVQQIVGPYDSANPPTLYRHDGNLGPESHGGMVLDNDGNVIGMITADQSSSNRGPRLAHESADILAMLTDASIANEQTDLDRSYRAGLDAYFAGRYREAVRNLDAVLAVQADNVYALSYREHASVRLAIEGEGGFGSSLGSPLILIVGGGLAVLLIVALLVAFIVRGVRLRARDREIAQYEAYLPISGVPVSGLPRSGVQASGAPYSQTPTSGGSGIPVASGAPWVSNTGTWVVPVSTPPASAVPDQMGTPAEYVPPASPTTPAGEPPPDSTQDPSANWPAVTVWRTPHGDGTTPPDSTSGQRVKTNPWGPAPQDPPPGS